MTHRRWRASLVLVVLGVGCAYYNGLYNANRLAGDAKRAEREGRAGEARSLWAQAAVKAESVATRYPTSRHWDDALLLWGRGLSRAGDCRGALPPLAMAVDSASDAEIRRSSRIILAQCRLDMRDPEGALLAVEPLLDDPDSLVVREALLLRAQAHLRLGKAEAAAEDLRRVPLETGAFDLARAFVALEDFDAAEAVLMRRVAGPFTEPGWILVLQTLGVQEPARASTIVDSLLQRADLTPGQRGRLLLADGERWLAAEPDRAGERFATVAAVAADSVEGAVARAHLAVAELRALDDLARLPAVHEQLREASRGGGRSRAIAAPALDGARIALETLEATDERGRDLRLFLLGELFRDSLHAPTPATQLFLRLSGDHPSSMIAAKSLLAAAHLDVARSDSIRRVLDARYPTSPYTLFLRGEAGAAFRVAEDSLRTVLAMTQLGDVGEQERGVGERRQGSTREQ